MRHDVILTSQMWVLSNHVLICECKAIVYNKSRYNLLSKIRIHISLWLIYLYKNMCHAINSCVNVCYLSYTILFSKTTKYISKMHRLCTLWYMWTFQLQIEWVFVYTHIIMCGFCRTMHAVWYAVHVREPARHEYKYIFNERSCISISHGKLATRTC